MTSKRHRVGRSFLPSLVGRTAHERLRSTILGLLGLITAAGLGLVAIASDQSLPGMARSGLPPVPRRHVGEAKALTAPSSSGRAVVLSGRRLVADGGFAAVGVEASSGTRHASQQVSAGGGGAPAQPGAGSPPAPGGGGHSTPGSGGHSAPGRGHSTPGPTGGAEQPEAQLPSAPAGQPPAAPVAAPPTEGGAPPAPAAPPESGGHGNDKAKGHEKAPVGEPPLGEQAEGVAASPGNGKGNAFGHSK